MLAAGVVPVERPVILDGGHDPYASEFLFFGTRHGVYAYDRDAMVWSRYTTRNGLADNSVRLLGLDEGILWVVTDSGLASADVRINDWQTYDVPGRITGLAFDEDYVWVGGDSGLHRFDKYVESWEPVIDVPVNRLTYSAGLLWLATDTAVLRYDPEFERLECTPAPRRPYDWVAVTPGRLWFGGSGEAGECRVVYDRDMGNWATHVQPGMVDTAALGDSLFVLQRGGVTVYDPASDDWRPLVELDDVRDARGLAVRGGRLLLATDHGLLGYDLDEMTRTWYGVADGLVADSLVDAYEDQGYVYAVSRGAIQYLDKETGIWRVEPLVEPGARREQVFFLDEAGMHFRPTRETDIRLAGRAHYSDSRTFTGGQVSRADYENVSLSLVGLAETGRTWSAYYDDSDKDQVMFGAGFRGAEGDVLHRVNAGHLETEYFEFDLVPQSATLGGNALLKAGRRSVGLQGGYLQSQLRHDFFFGRSAEKAVELQDISFARNRFYDAGPLGPGSDTVFVDDRSAATNGIDTRVGWTVGGIVGDFDLLISGQDYFIDHETGVLQFVTQRDPADVIVFRAGEFEVVLQSDSVHDRERLNLYQVGPNITPGTFELTISDTLGNEHAPAEFDLDSDGDGRVEPQFLNHDLGWLEFPELRPFPDAVYDDTVSVYTMNIGFRSRSTFYYLGHRPIKKGSDRVRVDGELVGRGADYAIDYTSGILLFLRDDLVSDFSEVEVSYSSVGRDRDAFLLAVQPVFAAGPGIMLAPGFTRVEDDNLFHLSGEAERAFGDNVGIRFVPQVAVASRREWAQDHALTATWGVASLNAGYRGFSDGFEALGGDEKKYGRLRHSVAGSAVVEPVAYMRLDGQFTREWQEDTLAGDAVAQYAWGRASFRAPDLPGGYVLAGQDNLPDYTKRRLRANAGYERVFGVARLRLNGTFRTVTLTRAVGEKEGLLEYIADFGFALPFPVRGDIRYRHCNRDRASVDAQVDDELRARLNVDVIPGCFYTGSYETDRADLYAPGVLGHDLELDHGFYNTLNVAPGRWWDRFSIVNFTFGTGSSFNQYARFLPDDHRGSFLVLTPDQSGLVSSLSRAENAHMQVQLQPVAELVLWARHSLNRSGTAYHGPPELRSTVEDEVRAEYEPGRIGRVSGVWKRQSATAYPALQYDNWYIEWSMPWSERLRTGLTGNYRVDREGYVLASTIGRELNVGLEGLLRFGVRSFVFANLGGTRGWSAEDGTRYTVNPGGGVNLNLFEFLYVRLDYESTLSIDGAASHLLSGRVTAQF